MERLVIDTNLYVDWLNERRYEAVLFRSEAVRYLSAVVLMELRAGAFSLRDRRLVQQLKSTFGKVDRILIPTAAVYDEAGEVLRRLQALRHYSLASAYGLVNDVLIALSARSIGATVVTQNERDFAAIQNIRPFKLAAAPV
jgi:tRNA(fMet)-specific endonuclease VapC